MSKRKGTFSFNPPKNISEEGKRLSAESSFETTNFVFNIPDENNGYSIRTAGHFILEGRKENVDKLNEILELRSQNDFDLHVKEVGERGTRIELEQNGYNLTGFEHLKMKFLQN